MRKVNTLVACLSVGLVMSGCALRDRQWGACAVGGAVIGAAAGGIAGGAITNNLVDDPTNGERGGAIVGGVLGGGILGALLGHALCDPMKETPPPPPAPPPPPPPAKPIVTLRGPHFAFDKYSLTPEGERAVGEAVRVMKENPNLRVSVDGYTDSIGSDAYNQKLSERRAGAVRDHMVAEGVDAARIETRGFGKSNPVASNATAEGRAENRRVEINPK